MDKNTKSARFGAKQEAIITPKEGYEVESVSVVNTADNSVIPSELRQDKNIPNQWVCSFVQPAAHVVIKPVTKPILYSVSFETSDTCAVVLVEQDSMAEIEIKSAIDDKTADKDNAAEENTEMKQSDFNHPQHSVNTDANKALDVGGNNSEEADNPSITDEPNDGTDAAMDAVKQDGKDDYASHKEDEGGEKPSDEKVVTDVSYDAGNFAEELEEIEPQIITRKQYNDKNELYWRWKHEFDTGKCPEEKFKNIQAKHLQWIDDINAGKIVIE